MKVPKLETAVVPAAKMTNYLLSETHPDGKHKAKFFEAFGFTRDDWKALERAVRKHAMDHELAKVEQSPIGVRYIVEGIMKTPDGRAPFVRAVWFVKHDEDVTRFVTAYPLRRRVHD